MHSHSVTKKKEKNPTHWTATSFKKGNFFQVQTNRSKSSTKAVILDKKFTSAARSLSQKAALPVAGSLDKKNYKNITGQPKETLVCCAKFHGINFILLQLKKIEVGSSGYLELVLNKQINKTPKSPHQCMVDFFIWKHSNAYVHTQDCRALMELNIAMIQTRPL